MKRKILFICVWFSTALFVLFASLYIYVLVADPQTYLDDWGIHWPNITIIHNPSLIFTNYSSAISTNYPLYKRTFVGDPSIHVAVTKDDWNGNLIFFNQKSPYVGGTIALTGTNDHSANDVSEKGWDGFGTYFRIIKGAHRPDNWWTLEISLWYPIILFGILPAIFVIKKMRAKISR